ncbi:MAG: glycosyltransferase [Bdellovibrionota bacterium]
MNIGIITPVWNDWESAKKLYSELDEMLFASGHQATLWFVDDGSTEQLPERMRLQKGKAILDVFSIELRNNQGHQRAIAAALAHLSPLLPGLDGILIMDCDGEDKPASVPALLAACSGTEVVIAQRAKRYEHVLFRAGYFFYKILFFLCTGKTIRFGNFLFLPSKHADSVSRSQYTAIHLAATVVRLQLPFVPVKVDRGRRYAGSSRMNFTSLVLHGLNAISVFSDVVLSRLILFTVIATSLCLAASTAPATLGILAESIFGAILLGFLLFLLHRSNAHDHSADLETSILRVRRLSGDSSSRLELLALHSP